MIGSTDKRTNVPKALLSAFKAQFFPQVGDYYPSLQSFSESTETALPYAKDVWVSPYPIFRKCRFDRISARVVTPAGAGGKFKMGIYDSDLNKSIPKNLLYETGDVDSTGAGLKAVTIDWTLNIGMYWLAIISDTSSPVAEYSCVRDVGFGFPSAVKSNYSSTVSWAQYIGSYELPNPFTGTEPSCVFICMHLRVAEILDSLPIK